MAIEQFDDAVVIDGSQDITQLKVQGHSTQTEPLQAWEDSAGDEQALLTGDGRLQVGSFDNGMMATDDSLIEAHRDEDDIAKPKRGLHLLGEITGALDSLVSWAVQELVLKGTGGISALHSALRVRLTNENTGTMASGADLRGADVEVINTGGSSGNPVPDVAALHAALTNQVGGYIDTAYGLRIRITDDGSIAKVYAIHTEEGIIHLDSELELPVLSNPPAANPDTGFIKLYVALDDDTPQLYGRDASGTLHLLSGTGTVDWNNPGTIGFSTPNHGKFNDLQFTQSFLAYRENSDAWHMAEVYSNSNWHASKHAGKRAHGTFSSPAILELYDWLGGLEYHGYDGTDFQPRAQVYVEASEDWDSENQGLQMMFRINGNGETESFPPPSMVISGQTVDVPGTLSKGSGTFHIDHPVDPYNRDLLHGFVEGPRFDLIYRGQAQLTNGTARASIDAASNMSPGTFEALTQNPQLWLHNADGWDLVRGQVVDGEVVIQSQNPESTDVIDWLVVAERADGFIRSLAMTDDEGRLIPEQDKPEPTGRETAPLDDPDASEDYEIPAVNLVGKRGYPRHAKQLNLDAPLPRRPVKAVRAGSSENKPRN